MPNSGHQAFIQDIQDGQGPDGPPDSALTALLEILNGRYSRYPGNILKNAQSPDSTTLEKGPNIPSYGRLWGFKRIRRNGKSAEGRGVSAGQQARGDEGGNPNEA